MTLTDLERPRDLSGAGPSKIVISSCAELKCRSEMTYRLFSTGSVIMSKTWLKFRSVVVMAELLIIIYIQ